MKLSLLHLSDSHLKPLEEILKGFDADIIIHSGDALMSGDLVEGQKFLNEWDRATRRFKYRIFSPGNHDIHYGKNNFFWKKEFNSRGTIFLDGEGTEVEGVYFWGHTKIPWISSGYWYGECHELERRKALECIPKDKDKMVIIAHSPPKGVLDICHFEGWDGMIQYGPNWGCPALREFLYDLKKPALACLSGHLHSAREVTGHPIEYLKTRYGRTLVSNASICNEAYKPVFNPVLIELEV